MDFDFNSFTEFIQTYQSETTDKLTKMDGDLAKVSKDIEFIKGKIEGRNEGSARNRSNMAIFISSLTFVLGAAWILYRMLYEP